EQRRSFNHRRQWNTSAIEQRQTMLTKLAWQVWGVKAPLKAGAAPNSGLLLKQFLAPFRLRIIWVLNLDPMWRSFLGHAVNGIAPLRNDAFKIKFADLSEELFATRLDVIYVEYT